MIPCMRIGEFVASVAMRHRVKIFALAVFTGLALTGQLSNLYSLVASTTTSVFLGDKTVLFFSSEAETHSVGAISDIDVRLNAASPINTVGATIKFDPEAVVILGIIKEKSFLDLWAEETSIKEEAGEIRFSGGTVQRGGFLGSGTVLTIMIRPKKEGRTELSFTQAQVFAHDGKGSVLESEKRPFSLTIEPTRGEGAAPQDTPPPSADFNQDGGVTLADISILAIQLLADYSARYDLDRDGNVNLKDVSIVFAKMKTGSH